MEKPATPPPNSETREAIEELKQGGLQAFGSVEALINALEIERLTAINAELVREISALTDGFIFASDADVFRLIDDINTALARAKENSNGH